MQNAIKTDRIVRNRYIRPLVVSILVIEMGELFLLIFYGMVLFPEGNMFHKVLWTLVFCGIGMGATVGALTSIFVVDRFDGITAVLMTTLASFLILGIACNWLCLNLDMHFHYFGASTNPYLFSSGSVIGSIIAGLVIGGLLFTEKGNGILERLGM